MLLRRIVEHVKDQNWTAISLDFLIVVVGVFIGIQAANWNDERRAREQRAASMDRLYSEAEASVAYLRHQLEGYRLGAEARSSVLEKTANGNIEAVEQREMVLAINYIVFFPPVAPPRSVYDEIISTGRFMELGNTRLRDAINNYYSALDHLSSSIEYSRMLSQQWQIWQHPSVMKQFDPEDTPQQTRTVVDIETALNDPLFVKSLQMGHSLQMLSMAIWEGTLVVAEKMCAEIASYLERQCTSLEDVSS